MVTEYEETELVRPAPVLPGLLAAFPLALFTAALATDIAYAVTSDMIWADFSDWLLAGGLAIGILAFIAALVAAITHRRAPAARPTFPSCSAAWWSWSSPASTTWCTAATPGPPLSPPAWR